MTTYIKRRKLKHPKCPDCSCYEAPKPVSKDSDWRIGGVLYCVRKKNGEEYNTHYTQSTDDTLRYLHDNPGSADRDLVFHYQSSAQISARRCELRDAGVVVAVGETVINGKTHTLWALNEEGERVWRQLHG